MGIRECYEVIGDYEEILSRLRSDVLIIKFAKKYLEDQSYEKLEESLKKNDFENAFHAAHCLKGVAKNLAFSQLAESSSVVTELLRDRQPKPIDKEMAILRAAQTEVIETIQLLEK